MHFQVLEKSEENFTIFVNQNIEIVKELPGNLNKSINYHPSLKDIQNCEFSEIYVHGNNHKDYMPDLLKKRFNKINNRIEAYYRSYYSTNTMVHDMSIIDLIPIKLLTEYCSIRQQASNFILKTKKKPKNYNLLLKILKVVSDIDQQKLNIDYKKANHLIHPRLKNLHSFRKHVYYNPWVGITGRMGLKEGSFPITNWPKKLRGILKPNNHYFVEFDLNAAEIRTALALSGQIQPDIDIHEWHNQEKFNGEMSRSDIKIDFYSWFYNHKKYDHEYEKYYDRHKLKENHYRNGHVYTVFDRVIKCSEDKWFSYLIQSTASDLFFHRLYEIWKILLHCKTKIAFAMHDSVILDVHEDDIELLPQIKQIFSQTFLGDFLVNCSWGFNYGEMCRTDMF